MKLCCVHADTCLPDYWGGHHKAHVSVPVWRGMTPKALRDALRSELSQGAVMGSDELARLLSADLVRPDEEKRADAATRAAYAAIRRDVKPAKKGVRRLFPDLEPDDETDDCRESVYAYFIFSED
jgi:hypothetical protein